MKNVRTFARLPRLALIAGALSVGAVLAGCSGGQQEFPNRSKGEYHPTYGNEKQQTVFGPGGLFNNDNKNDAAATGGPGIAVNGYLWRASLDTLAFMPLVSADPFGGVIITDWYSPPASPNERFKMNVYILSRELRADGIRVAVFHEVRKGDGWTNTPAAPQTATDLEDAILTRARQLRLDAAQQK